MQACPENINQIIIDFGDILMRIALKFIFTTILAGAFVSSALCQDTAAKKAPASAKSKIRFGKPIEYKSAGISVALPFSYGYQQLFEDFQVMLASDVSLGKISRSVSLIALPVTKKTDSKSIIKMLIDDKKDNILFRYFKSQTGDDKLKVAGLSASSVFMSYTHRGVKTVAYSVCFTRDIKLAKSHVHEDSKTVRIAYILSIEAAELDRKYVKQFMPALCNQIKLTEIQRPTKLKIDTEPDHCQYVNVPTKGYGIKVPNNWISDINDLGISLWMTDYKAGGISNPSMQILTFSVPAGLTAKTLGKKSIEYERKNSKAKIEILSESKTKVARKEAYQYVIKKSIDPKLLKQKSDKPGDKKSEENADAKKVSEPKAEPDSDKKVASEKAITLIEVQRLVCVKSKSNKKQRYFALILTCQDVTPKQAVELMDKLCKKFTIYEPKNIKFKPNKPKSNDLELPPDIKDQLEK